MSIAKSRCDPGKGDERCMYTLLLTEVVCGTNGNPFSGDPLNRTLRETEIGVPIVGLTGRWIGE
jgi:hypothetical protein